MVGVQEMCIEEPLEFIHQYSPPGGLVLDLYAGTGKVGMAALRLNRLSVLVEIDQDLVLDARQRMRKHYKWVRSVNALLPGIDC